MIADIFFCVDGYAVMLHLEVFIEEWEHLKMFC